VLDAEHADEVGHAQEHGHLGVVGHPQVGRAPGHVLLQPPQLHHVLPHGHSISLASLSQLYNN
jgi:hypothetical protein